jgi:hypothetical protein
MNRAQDNTSENAGAAIFLYFFHSSPSEATMFAPKTDNTSYRNTGLGNLARCVVISYKARSKTSDPADIEYTYFDSGSISDMYDAVWHRKCGNLQVVLS